MFGLMNFITLHVFVLIFSIIIIAVLSNVYKNEDKYISLSLGMGFVAIFLIISQFFIAPILIEEELRFGASIADMVLGILFFIVACVNAVRADQAGKNSEKKGVILFAYLLSCGIINFYMIYLLIISMGVWQIFLIINYSMILTLIIAHLAKKPDIVSPITSLIYTIGAIILLIARLYLIPENILPTTDQFAAMVLAVVFSISFNILGIIMFLNIEDSKLNPKFLKIAGIWGIINVILVIFYVIWGYVLLLQISYQSSCYACLFFLILLGIGVAIAVILQFGKKKKWDQRPKR